MINQEAFEKTCKLIGIDSQGMSSAGVAYVWNCAEMAMLRKSNQTPALLKAEDLAVQFAEEEKHTADFSPLTRSEVQYLTSRVRWLIQDMHEAESKMKAVERVLWEECDPSDLRTKPSFSVLNNVREARRDVRKERAKLANIQAKMKRLLSLPSE